MPRPQSTNLSIVYAITIVIMTVMMIVVVAVGDEIGIILHVGKA